MAGSGDYFFDLSCDGAASITQIQNQLGPGPQGEAADLSQPAVELFPNPAKAGRVTVQYALPHAGLTRVALLDVSGRVVKSMEIAADQSGSVGMDLRGLRAGVYVVKLEFGPTGLTRKFMIH